MPKESIQNYGYNLDDFQDSPGNEFFLTFLEQYRVSLGRESRKEQALLFAKEESYASNLECQHCCDGDTQQEKKEVFRRGFSQTRHFGYFQGKFEWIYQITPRDREFIRLELDSNAQPEYSIEPVSREHLDVYIRFHIRHNNYLKLFGLIHKHLGDRVLLDSIKSTLVLHQKLLSRFVKQQIVT